MATKKTTKKKDAETVAISFDDMSYGDLEALEEAIGFIPDGKEAFDALPKSKVLTGMAFVAKRREDPSVTLAEVRAMPIGSVVMAGDTDPA